MDRVRQDEFFNLSSDLMCIVGRDGSFQRVNPAWTCILGWLPEEVVGKHYIVFVHRADHVTTKNFQKQFSPGSQQSSFINRYVTKDGGFRWINWAVQFDAEKHVYFAVGRDVTDEKRVAQLSEQLESIAAVGAWEYVFSEARFYITPGMRQLMEIEQSSGVYDRERFESLLEPSTRAEVFSYYERLFREGTPYDIQFGMRTFGGKPIWVRAVARAETYEGKIVRLFGSLQGLTKEHNAQQQLVRTKQQYQNLIEGINDLIWEKDLVRDQLTFISERQCLDLYGVEAGEILINPDLWLDRLHPEDRGFLTKATAKVMRDGHSESQYRVVGDNGTWRWILDRAKLHCNEKGEPVLLHGIASDITEQIQRDKLLLEQKEKFETIVNNIPVFLAYIRDDRVEWINEAWSRSLGWTETELCDERLLENIWAVDWRSIASQSESGVPHYWGDKKSLTKSGVHLEISWAFIPLSNKNLIVIGQDVSRQRDQERVIAEQQAKIFATAKMSSLGEMAGGVAHEINNPLAIIHARSRQLRQFVSDSSENKEQIFDGLDRIENTVMRIAKIVRGLRSFARNADGDPFVVVPIASVIDDALELCRERFRNNSIDLRFDAAMDVLVSCRPTQIAQVLLNLLNNAYDAVEMLETRWVEIRVNVAATQCQIFVTDSGTGIERSVRERMMEPFFTTKPVGKGTGLGLSIIRGIMEIHKGRFYFDADHPNTRFVLELPSHVVP